MPSVAFEFHKHISFICSFVILGELIGVEYLFSQTGQVLEDYAISKVDESTEESTEEETPELEEPDEDGDEGFDESEYVDFTVPCLTASTSLEPATIQNLVASSSSRDTQAEGDTSSSQILSYPSDEDYQQLMSTGKSTTQVMRKICIRTYT